MFTSGVFSHLGCGIPPPPSFPHPSMQADSGGGWASGLHVMQGSGAGPSLPFMPHGPMAGPGMLEGGSQNELEQAVERFIANSTVDSRAIASLRAQEPDLQRAVLDRGELSDCQNPSAALMGRIQVAKDHVNFERNAAAGRVGGPAACSHALVDMGRSVATTTMAGMHQSSLPEVEDFIRENRLDDSAARQLREADSVVQKSVLSLGNFKNCRNPSAVCLARIREAGKASIQARIEDRQGQMQLQAAQVPALVTANVLKTGYEEELEKFLQDNNVDSRAAAALRVQAPEVQRCVLDRGELTDCQNPSTALMGRIRVAHENISFERKRAQHPTGEVPPSGLSAAALASPTLTRPPTSSPEIEDFIQDNNIDGLAAKQLREAERETQEDVVARGSLSDCRNPSAVCLARIRDSRDMAKARLVESDAKVNAQDQHLVGGPTGNGTSAVTPTASMMMPFMPMGVQMANMPMTCMNMPMATGMPMAGMPMVGMPMANMIMMANMQSSMASMMPMAMMNPMMMMMGAAMGCMNPMMGAMGGAMGAMCPMGGCMGAMNPMAAMPGGVCAGGCAGGSAPLLSISGASGASPNDCGTYGPTGPSACGDARGSARQVPY